MTQAQNRLIWVLAKQLGMDSEALHDFVFGVTGKESMKALSVMEGKAVIEAMTRLGSKIKKKRKPRRDLPPNVVEMATQKQLRLIKYFEKKLGWQDNPERLNGFARRTIKKKVISTKLDAMKVIEGLKGMANREQRKGVENEENGVSV